MSEEGKPLSEDDLTEEAAHKRLAEVEAFKHMPDAKDPERVTRLDFTGRFDSSRRTPQGGLKVPAYLTRVGVLSYRQKDGNVVRELRHPDEVFKADSLATLEAAPVTIGHPGKVAPGNWGQHTVGHVGEQVSKADDKYVSATLRIQDSKAVHGVEKGELLELSCGYDCDVLYEPGEFNGEKYDARQTNIVYNHVALLPKNGGRAGNDVRLRLDGETEVPEDMPDVGGKLPENHMDEATKKELETLRQDKADLQKKLDEANGKLDAQTKELADLRDPARMDAAAEDLSVFRSDARVILGTDADVKGPRRDVMIAALVKCDSEFKADGRTDEYLRGAFAAEVKRTKVAAQSAATVRQTADAAQTSVTESPVDEARKRNDERSRNAWKAGK